MTIGAGAVFSWCPNQLRLGAAAIIRSVRNLTAMESLERAQAKPSLVRVALGAYDSSFA